MMRNGLLTVAALFTFLFILANWQCFWAKKTDDVPGMVDFNWQVRPILSDRCYNCHGPDEKKRQGGLRLDTKEGAFAQLTEGKSGRFAIVPGHPEQSEMIYRIYSAHADTMMPTPESHLTLTDREKKILVRWIEQGAQWKEHWAFSVPVKAAVPATGSWGENEIDAFVQQKLTENNLEPTAETDRASLLRRAAFVLTGLPPSPQLVEQYLADQQPDAYNRAVDSLLASSAYGERWAMYWLDLSRYADTHGYQDDLPRTMWPWRDWVIKALNQNMPYNQFVTWQLAGDLMPDATKEMLIASGFNRNHKISQEGGVIEEEYRVEYVSDRTNTFGKAFMGLTMECARCHDHKYDPIATREYYALSAFFNKVPERGFVPNLQTPMPYIKVTLADIHAGGDLAFLNIKESLKTEKDTLRLMVMHDSIEKGGRQAYILKRGQYDAHGDPVNAYTPGRVLPFDTTNLPRNRLGLSSWLFDPKNPLTARVWVNRLWQEVFGRGIVATSDNFGVQGALPSHPELLDWLAVELQEHQWDTKHLLRMMVTSATFRQSSVAKATILAADPENIWLSHGPRMRLPYEFIRDNILASSGLLISEIGGPPCKPWQPPGIWEEIASDKTANAFRGESTYIPDTAANKIYRRSLYTYQRRTIPPPSHLMFDAPARDNCEVKRARSNTPLQSLVLLNDPQVQEAARVMAAQLLRNTALTTAEDRIKMAFSRIVIRSPNTQEIGQLANFYAQEKARMTTVRAKKLLSVGRYPQDPTLECTDLAALMQTICVVYNLDEAISL